MFADDPRWGSDPRERDDDARNRDPVDPRDAFVDKLDLPRELERELVHDRDREYTLRGSESQTPSLVGSFRVISSRDLSDHDGRPLTVTSKAQEEQRLLTAALDMNGPEHKCVGSAMHDRLVGALETCCRQGEMLRIQNRHVDGERHQIAIPGANAKDAENRRIPFDPHGRLAPILKRRAALGPSAYVFGSEAGEFVASFKTAWESLLLLSNSTRGAASREGGPQLAFPIDPGGVNMMTGRDRAMSEGLSKRQSVPSCLPGPEQLVPAVRL